jgi:hypothetical protein
MSNRRLPFVETVLLGTNGVLVTQDNPVGEPAQTRRAFPGDS